MKIRNRLPLLVLCLTFSVCCRAEEKSPKVRQGQVIYSRVECRRDKDTRVLEIDSTEQETCRLQYRVGKKRHHVVGATSGRAACLKEREKILNQLIAEKWQCEVPADPFVAGK